MSHRTNPFEARGTILRCLAAMAVAALACTIDLGGPVPLDAPTSASGGNEEDAGQMWQNAVAGAATTGQVTLLFDEVQVTRLLQERLAKDKSPAFESPVVLLRQGMIQVYGVGHQGPFRANVYLSITPVLTPEGALALELTSAEYGPLPVPEGVREGLSSLLTEVLSGPLGSMATGVRITSVAVDGGQLAIVGELR